MKKTTKLIRKAISVFMSSVMLGTTCISASFAGAASSRDVLRADANGNFKVLQVADLQEHESTDGKTHFTNRSIKTIKMAVEILSPDLIVLTGDNIYRADSLDDFDLSVKTLVAAFKGTPFAVTYGNHDLERNKHDDEYLTYKQEQEIYDKYGAVELNQTGLVITDNSDYSTSKYGTGYIDVYNADGTKVVNRVILVNSGTYELDSDSPDGDINNKGEGYGRPGVNAKTFKNIDYDNVVAAVEKWTDEGVKCIAFQHIPMQEFFTSGIIVEGDKNDVLMNGRQPEQFRNKYYKNAVKNTRTNQFVEPCGCSYYSTEALYKAFAKSGNTLSVSYGHDHTNTIMAEGECYGMKLVQGYGGGLLVYPADYGEDSPEADYNPMVGLFTISENNLVKETITFNALNRQYILEGYWFRAIINFFKRLFRIG